MAFSTMRASLAGSKVGQRASNSMLGARLVVLPTASQRLALAPVSALFRAATTASPKNGAKASAKVNGKGSAKVKVLKPGKDIKAQQFQIGLGKQKRTVALGFTKANELFVSRWAMLGFAAAVVGEIATGKGALAQLGLETGLPITDVDGIILFIIAFNVVAALTPASGKFVPDEQELEERPAGPLQSAKVTLATPKKFLGIKGFGFTKENELFVGRLAQLGFAAALLGEALTGKGPLAQLGLETGIPLSEAEPLLLGSIIFTLFAAVNEGSGKFIKDE